MGSTPPDIMRDREKRSFWCLAVVFLLVDSCSGALLDRSKRQGNGDFGNMVQHFLQSDDQAQLDYVRYGLDLLEDGVNGSLGELSWSTGIRPRIGSFSAVFRV